MMSRNVHFTDMPLAAFDFRLHGQSPAWASTWRWKSSRELVTASEANRRASFREAGVKEAGSEAAGRRTETGYEAEPSGASVHQTAKLL
jgi:hypothetical protein